MHLLMHAHVFITQAGMGSAAESLWFEVPTVAISQAVDQHQNADALEATARGPCATRSGGRAGPPRRPTPSNASSARVKRLAAPSGPLVDGRQALAHRPLEAELDHAVEAGHYGAELDDVAQVAARATGAEAELAVVPAQR